MTTTTQKTKIGKGWDGEVSVIKNGTIYKKVPNSEVFETTQYSNFKKDTKNRPIAEEKVNYFMRTFKSGKFFMKEFPIIISKDMIILDGQHRFEAVKNLELPLYFRYADTLTIDDIVDVQLNAGWKIKDFIHAFIKQKKQDYIVLNRFVLRYKLSPTVAVMLLSGSLRGGLKHTGFYEGNLKIKDESIAHEQAKAINKIGEMAMNLHRDRAFCLAVMQIITHPDYEEKRLLTQMDKYRSLMKRHMTIENYIRNIEEIYNYRLFTKNKIRFV